MGDPQTAEWFASLIGKSLQTFVGGSMAPSKGAYDDLMTPSQYTGSYSQHYESTLQNNVFMNGLRTGGEANGLLCDAIVVKSGEPFSSGDNHALVTFSQE